VAVTTRTALATTILTVRPTVTTATVLRAMTPMARQTVAAVTAPLERSWRRLVTC
jgi:hypothetical protein